MRPHIITGTCTGVIEPSSSVTHSAWHVEPPLLRSMILSEKNPMPGSVFELTELPKLSPCSRRYRRDCDGAGAFSFPVTYKATTLNVAFR
jgi:hypothetical protein